MTAVLIINTITFDKASSKSLSEQYVAKTVEELDKHGEKFNNKEIHRSTQIIFNTFDVSETTLTIDGFHRNRGERQEFYLVGDLFASTKSSERVIGALEDKMGNFEVVHFSIDSGKDKGFLFNEKLTNTHDTIIKLYLRDLDNNNFTYLELTDTTLLSGSLYQSDIDNSYLEPAEFIEENWYAKILTPVSIEEIYEDDPGHIGIMSSRTGTVNRTYSLTYQMGGINVNEFIRVRHHVTYDFSPSGANVWESQMRIIRKWTTSTEPAWNGENSNMRIGFEGNVVIRAKTSNNEGISSVAWSSTYNGSNPRYYVRLNLERAVGPVVFGANWDTNNLFRSNGNLSNFYNDSSNLQRRAQIEFDNQIFDRVNHNANANFTVRGWNSSGSKEVYVDFIYTVTNLHGYVGPRNTVRVNQHYYHR